jgi:hypothetical protein
MPEASVTKLLIHVPRKSVQKRKIIVLISSCLLFGLPRGSQHLVRFTLFWKILRVRVKMAKNKERNITTTLALTKYFALLT